MSFDRLTAFECRNDHGLLRLVWNRPAENNVFTSAFCNELNQIANEVSESRDIRAVLMTSTGRLFSAGGDLRTLSEQRDTLPAKVKSMTAALHMAIARLMAMDAPVVCAVHAPIYGGSVALVAASDFVLAGSSAKFGSAFTGIGFSCDSGATVGLVQRMGVARARRFVMLGETLSAEEALSCGLADFVTPDSDLEQQAEALAQKLANGPTCAYGEIKRLFLAATQRPMPAQLEEEASALARVARTDDAWEGIGAFKDKRAPRFMAR